MILVGFRTKLKLMDILDDELRIVKEFSVRDCTECCFSHGGQYFAAVNQQKVQIYATYTCEEQKSLRHNSQIQSICWKADDSMLVTSVVLPLLDDVSSTINVHVRGCVGDRISARVKNN